MKKEPVARIHDLVGLIHGLYSPSLAEEWDNVGLQVGDPSAEINRVLLCLDPTEAALGAALAAGAQALVSHHPLIFRSLKSLIPQDETSRVLFRAVREGISIVSAHTNLDRAADGLNDWLARRLGLAEAKPLASGGADLTKLVVFVPTGYEGRVSEALFRAGAGQIGAYDSCSFRTQGKGTYRPGQGTDPFIGTPGTLEQVAEVRLETIVSREALGRSVARMIKAHPYEEPAYDLIPLSNRRSDVGLGRIGRLAEPQRLEDYALQVKQALGVSHLRVVGQADQKISKVALCGGGGASLLTEAARQGADVLVTGDVKYHEAQNALSQGIALLDAGHFGTEHLMVEELTQRLRQAAQQRKLNIDFQEMRGEADPFRVV